MGRMYKCALCKTDVNPDVAYVRTSVNSNTGKITYKRYCSEEEYLDYEREMTFRKMTFDIMRDLLAYSEKQVLPTTINKKVSELHQGYSYQSIYETFVECRDTLDYWCSLDGKFDKEYQKIAYIFAIITNSINEVDKKIKREKALDKKQESHSVELELFDDIPVVNTNKKDISSFLD